VKFLSASSLDLSTFELKLLNLENAEKGLESIFENDYSLESNPVIS